MILIRRRALKFYCKLPNNKNLIYAAGCLLMNDVVMLNCCLLSVVSANFSKLLCLSGVVWCCCCENYFLLHVLLTQCMVQRSLRHDDFDTKNTFCTISIDDCKKVPFIFSALFDVDGITEAISILPVVHDRSPAITCIFILLLLILMCTVYSVAVFLLLLFCTICYLFTLFANWLRYCIRTRHTTAQK